MSGQATLGWRAVQDAVSAAIVAASRLPPDQVRWAYQNADQGVLPYIKLSIPRIDSRGIDWVQQTYDATRQAGQEFAEQVQGIREMTIELEAFTETPDGLNVFDERAAIFLVEQVKTQLALPSIKGRLQRDGGVAIFAKGSTEYVPTVVAAGFRGRATCTMRAYVPAQALLEYAGYIITVNGTMTVSGVATPDPAFPFTMDLDTGKGSV